MEKHECVQCTNKDHDSTILFSVEVVELVKIFVQSIIKQFAVNNKIFIDEMN